MRHEQQQTTAAHNSTTGSSAGRSTISSSCSSVWRKGRIKKSCEVERYSVSSPQKLQSRFHQTTKEGDRRDMNI